MSGTTARARAVGLFAVAVLATPVITGATAGLDAQALVPRLGEFSRIRLASDTTAPWTTGWVADLSLTQLTLRDDLGRDVQLPLETIHRFDVRRGTYLKEGALIGALLGIGIGLIGGESAGQKLLVAGSAAIGLGVTGASLGNRTARWVAVDVAYLLGR